MSEISSLLKLQKELDNESDLFYTPSQFNTPTFQMDQYHEVKDKPVTRHVFSVSFDLQISISEADGETGEHTLTPVDVLIISQKATVNKAAVKTIDCKSELEWASVVMTYFWLQPHEVNSVTIDMLEQYAVS